ncbi:DMT family transporter [Actinomadura opuntiae]|uniref:DMT family transporter n=1 Tax=Actinomadura sp. OS1-43 TaxID=604315 RepID=UPI00255B2B06|nr:EamA family transporter [Actinomadura sp. OS1-43]MDL4819911.1 EamA family transporter [Actinomadura sp. OS1-43]
MSLHTSRTSRTSKRRLSAPSRRPRGGDADILLAASLWGTTGTARTFAGGGASSVSVAAARIVIGGLLLLALAALTRRDGLRRLLTGRRDRALLALGAVAVAVYQTAFFVAVTRTGVAVGTVVTIGSAPAFTGLIGLATRRAVLTRRWTLATAGAVAGCALLVGAGHGSGVEPAGIALALLSGLSYAVYATAASVLIIRGEDDRAVAGALFGGAAVLLLPVLAAGSAGWLLTASGAATALYLGAVTTGLGYVLFTRGLRGTPATTATTLTLAEPAVAAVLGTAVLGEHLGAVACVGLALLAASLVVLVAPVRRPRKHGNRGGRSD